MFGQASGYLALVLALALASGGGVVSSCPLQQVGLIYHPGETIHLTVAFESPVTLTAGTFYLNLVSPARADQPGFSTQLLGSDFKQLSDREYEVSGQVREDTASGTWHLTMLNVRKDGTTKSYQVGADLPDNVTLRVENSKSVQFPAIKNVRVGP